MMWTLLPFLFVGAVVGLVLLALRVDARNAARDDFAAEVWRDLGHRQRATHVVKVDGRWEWFALSGQPELPAKPAPVEAEPIEGAA